ncbi:hypothetical protein N9L20_05830 [Flavobacteriaceae bacterium]|nr:hypothetical protein [Flavobacteriaceae bacterium]
MKRFNPILLAMLFLSLSIQAQKKASFIRLADLKVNNLSLMEVSHDGLKSTLDSKSSSYDKQLEKALRVLRVDGNNFEFDAENDQLVRFDLYSDLCNIELNQLKLKVGDQIKDVASNYNKQYENHKPFRSVVLQVYEDKQPFGKLYIKYNKEDQIASLHYYAK